MTRRRLGLTAPVLAAFLLLAYPADAFAYIDPGTGSYLFQLAAAGILAAGFTLRHALARAASFLRFRSRRSLKRKDDV